MPKKILILAFLSGADHLGDSDSENSPSSFLAALRGQNLSILNFHKSLNVINMNQSQARFGQRFAMDSNK